MTLNDFVQEMQNDVENFKKDWLENNSKDPESYPLEFADDYAGQWFEQFIAYCDIKGA